MFSDSHRTVSKCGPYVLCLTKILLNCKVILAMT